MAVGTPYQIATGQTTAANGTVTVGTATNPGDSVFVTINANGAVTGLTDTKGNTYVQYSTGSGAQQCYFFAATYKGTPGTPTAALTTSDTWTVVGGGANNSLEAAACSGIAPQAANVNPAYATTTSTTASESITPVNVGDFVIMWLAFGSNPSTITYANGFTKIADYFPSVNPVSLGYLKATSTSAVTAQAALGASVIWVLGSAGFAAAPVNPATRPPGLLHPVISNAIKHARLADTTGPPLPAGKAPWNFINGQVTGAVTSRVYTVPSGQAATNSGDTLLVTVMLA